jgi:hypothetical protein
LPLYKFVAIVAAGASLETTSGAYLVASTVAAVVTTGEGEVYTMGKMALSEVFETQFCCSF